MTKHYVITLFAASLLINLTSCKKEDDGNSCLEPPCGSIDETALNLTLLASNQDDITNVTIAIDEVIQPLSLNGWDFDNGVVFTCWQTIPDINPQSVVVLGYELAGEQVIGALNVQSISSNTVVIDIRGENAEISNYVACNDTP